MSAQPIVTRADTPWRPDPARQQRADYTIQDVLALPPHAPRVELDDGVMLVVPSPAEDHQEISSLVWLWLRSHTSRDEYKVIQAVGVEVSQNQTFEPDVLLRKAGGDGRRHYTTADQAVLAVEVVSAGTRTRDRFRKPAGYAAAGIPFYWRIEQNPVHVFAYRLGPDGRYELAADGTELLELEEPFPIKLPIADITP